MEAGEGAGMIGLVEHGANNTEVVRSVSHGPFKSWTR